MQDTLQSEESQIESVESHPESNLSLDAIYAELQDLKIQLNHKSADYFQAVARTSYDFHMGEPSDSQLEKIKQMTGIQDWQKSEWFVFTAHASDNLISRSQRKWTVNVLKQMESNLRGKVGLLDHEWEESNKSVGFLLDTVLVHQNDAPATIVGTQYAEFNRQIIANEGFYCLYVTFAVDAIGMESVVRAVKTRRLNGVSTGGLVDGVNLLCPNCSATNRVETSFFDEDCPHLIPNGGGRWMMEDDELEYADYCVMDAQSFDGIELSLVNSPNLSACKVVRE